MKERICVVSLALTIGITVQCIAQVPQTDLYLFQLTQDDSLRWHIHSPSLVSSWNQEGYTNQPEWLDDHTLLVSAQRIGETQNEIYLLNLREHLLRRMTDTPESEFSPLLTPDRNYISVIRQVHDDQVDQQIYQFPLDLSSPGVAVLPQIQNVGYHCWLNPNELALFLVDDPVKLALASTSESTPRIQSSAIGRCLRRTRSGDLAYVHKYSDTFWFLKTMDPVSRKSEILIETLYGKEDFAIGPSGAYFMGSGSILYVFDPDRTYQKWMPVFDLSIFGLQNITRLAINEKNQIAIVDQKT
ncbi:MAG TPA: hypothetical protein VI603_11775 [Saprospiraceae bacterium]|nr:hypothetical protein [Saprospiraceae bacterium]